MERIIKFKRYLHKIKLCIEMAIILCILISLTGCKGNNEKGVEKDIDYTICNGNNMPNELTEIIEEKKGEIFKLTYVTENYMYIAIGYGRQERSNLNVIIEELYMTDNAIYVETILKERCASPTDATPRVETQIITYPYIVIKCENYQLPVVFSID